MVLSPALVWLAEHDILTCRLREFIFPSVSTPSPSEMAIRSPLPLWSKLLGTGSIWPRSQVLFQVPFQPPPAAHGTSETLTGLVPSLGIHGAAVPIPLSGRPVQGLLVTEAALPRADRGACPAGLCSNTQERGYTGLLGEFFCPWISNSFTL